MDSNDRRTESARKPNQYSLRHRRWSSARTCSIMLAVAIVSTDAARNFIVRPRVGHLRSFSVDHGDHLVMGGSCQHDWEHRVLKIARSVGPLLSIMLRHNSTTLSRLCPEPAARAVSRRAAVGPAPFARRLRHRWQPAPSQSTQGRSTVHPQHPRSARRRSCAQVAGSR